MYRRHPVCFLLDSPVVMVIDIIIDCTDLPRGEPRGFAREGFWLGKLLVFHTEVFRVVLTDKLLWDRYLGIDT